MSLILLTPLAAVAPEAAQSGRPLFGSLPLAFAAVMAAIAVFMLMVALLGRWLAATHPDAPARSVPAPVAATAPAPSNDLLTAVIAASVASVLGEGAKVASVHQVAPSVEMLMQQWSMEGRRQIYSSHKVR